MQMAIEYAKKGVGGVNPNPLVGAVVVKDGEIVGYGYHKDYGHEHAEVFALDMAGEKTRNADLYVTLEPCSHFGKTPPCVDKVIKSGIKRCFIGMCDPNPKVCSKQKLRDAGIEVVCNILEKECMELNKVFIKYITKNKSYLYLKCGITLDGKIATKNHTSKWITNDLARNEVQNLRNQFMGIMVGVNTVIYDNPSLTSTGRNPIRIVLDPKLAIPIESKMLHFDDGKNIIITSSNNKNSDKISKLKDKARFVFLDGYDFSFDEILSETAKLGIDGILLEGGGNIISRAFREHAIDGGKIFIAPKIVGDNNAIPFASGFDIDDINNSINLKNVSYEIYGDNIALNFSKMR